MHVISYRKIKRVSLLLCTAWLLSASPVALSDSGSDHNDRSRVGSEHNDRKSGDQEKVATKSRFRNLVTADVDNDGQDDIIMDDSKSGIWIGKDNRSWAKLHGLTPETITKGDLDGNGQDDDKFIDRDFLALIEHGYQFENG